MGKLRDRMQEDLVLAGYQPKTRTHYIQCVKKFAEYHMCSPEHMGSEEVREFLLHLIEQGRATATVRVYQAAFVFLYRTTLRRPEVMALFPWPRGKNALPAVLSGSEVQEVLTRTQSLKYRAMFTTLYAAGLRTSEACSLHPEDIDSKRMLIHIREAKGRKDRYVMLGVRLLSTLREYCDRKRIDGRSSSPQKSVSAKLKRP